MRGDLFFAPRCFFCFGARGFRSEGAVGGGSERFFVICFFIRILGIAKWESSDQVRTLTAYGKDGRSILPLDIVRKQISPADFSKPVFKENLISFVRVNIEDSTKVDTLSSSPAPDSL